MDFQTIITNAASAARAEALKNSPQLTLGELIARLEPIEAKYKETLAAKAEGEKEPHNPEIYFDFEYLRPTGISSWRGSYAELALEFDGSKSYTVGEFIELLKSCIGKSFEGYKGGDFVMGKTTPIWVANYGNSGETGLVGVRDESYKVILETAKCDF